MKQIILKCCNQTSIAYSQEPCITKTLASTLKPLFWGLLALGKYDWCGWISGWKWQSEKESKIYTIISKVPCHFYFYFFFPIFLYLYRRLGTFVLTWRHGPWGQKLRENVVKIERQWCTQMFPSNYLGRTKMRTKEELNYMRFYTYY